jgi:TRAP transporter 4TM/12TM fusion protein
MQRTLIVSLAVAATALHLYAAGVAPLTALVQRPLHLALLGGLGFLGAAVGRSRHDAKVSAVGAALGVLLGAACVYLVTQQESLVARAGSARPLDLVAGVITVVAVLELARRTVGMALVSVALAALAYTQLGPWLPGILGHRGYSLARVIEHLYLGTEGIWGVPLGVSADFVFLFILFGTTLDAAGGGQLLIGLARRVAGGSRAASAKTAAVASAFMGSLSGSAVANVVTTGTLTIPMMKRAGFKPPLAGAIEAAASTGGQLVPPVMGAGAFILATWTNIPYLRVATAAAIPALLYYVALLASIHFTAGRAGMRANDDVAAGDTAGKFHLLLPLIGIVVLLAFGRSPMRAAFWGVVLAFTTAMLTPATRLSGRKLRDTLVAAASGAVQVAAACAAAGIIVGVATLTGIGLRMSGLIVTLSGGHLLLGLIWTALAGVVLGMGLPTTAAYVVLAALGAPALVELGAPVLAAHLFIFYFGCISNVTPPVSLAAYAAAGIAEAPAFRTAVAALLLAATGFLIPFAFVYGPGLLLSAPLESILLATGTALIGVVALAAAASGFHNRKLGAIERVALLIAAMALLSPSLIAGLLGGMALLISLARQRTPTA